MTDSLLRDRILRLQLKLGRPLRVLHIGNIANNAYIISKLLNEFGAESHVLCYDYYHVMGTPEWEDAFLDSNKINHFHPEWRSLDLGDFKRPDWYVQGPLELCLDYLCALQKRDDRSCEYFRHQLAPFNRTRQSLSPIIAMSSLIRQLKALSPLFLKLCGDLSVKDRFYSHFPTEQFRFSFLTCIQIAIEAPAYVLAFFLKRTHLTRFLRSNLVKVATHMLIEPAMRSDLISEFQREFPARPDQLSEADFTILNRYTARLGQVIQYYDIVQGYATDPILPMLSGHANFVAYEHGTIRTYVYDNAAVSRFAALAYRKAPVIFSTNADCLPSALNLKGRASLVVRGLHGFDERQVLKRVEFANKSRSKKEARFNISDDVCIFLQPARQDWKIKGNDRVLEAIRIVKSRRSHLKRPFVVVLTEWGNDVSEAKKFISRNGLEDDVQWIDILSKTNLVQSVAHVDAVIDQFLIPCIGAVPAEILTVAKGPIITYLDDQTMSDFYGRTLPILNAQTADEIANQMEKVINFHPDAKKSLEQSKSWVREIHSHRQVLSKCLDAYEFVLTRNSSDGQT